MKNVKTMEIIKNKNASWCAKCGRLIEKESSLYKVRDNGILYHISCYKNWLEFEIKRRKEKLVKMNIFLKKLAKFKKQLIVESL